MKVWVVVVDYWHDVTRPVGVFSTAEKAAEFVAAEHEKAEQGVMEGRLVTVEFAIDRPEET
jgi:hypothetical protein